MNNDNRTQRTVTITNKLGLHARPAALPVECCNSFRSEIMLEANDRVINGKHILDVMSLGAASGTELHFTITG
ncbi:MAG: HPr family phosphocarrier protein, partial [Chloroflexi bacterium]|nr:HPr family phosphocarrier protein [Chloroflexota bacterium]